MQPIYFSDALMKSKGDVIFNFYKTNFFMDWIYYIINSRYNTGVDMKNWINIQVQTAINSPPEDMKAVCDKITSDADYDKQAWQVMNWVQDFLKYKGNLAQWGTNEYWATPDETIS
jgi:hypothetical protein